MLLCTKESLPDVKETEHQICQIIILQKWTTSCCKERKHLWMRKKMYVYETHSSAQGLVCTNHRVFIVYKSDLITLSFAHHLLCFNFPTWRIMPKCYHRVRWLQLDSDSSSAILEQSPHLHSNCRALEMLREESRFFFSFPVTASTTSFVNCMTAYFLEYFGSFPSTRCCFALTNLKVSTGQVWSCKGNNCCNWQRGKQLFSVDTDSKEASGMNHGQLHWTLNNVKWIFDFSKVLDVWCERKSYLGFPGIPSSSEMPFISNWDIKLQFSQYDKFSLKFPNNFTSEILK